jgi:hypothetical protein
LKYEGKGLLALSTFEKKVWVNGKVITLDKGTWKGRPAYYPWEI